MNDNELNTSEFLKGPVRMDKVDYYSNLPTAHLIKEAALAEEILSSTKNVSDEEIQDSKVILKELNKRLPSK